MDIGFSEEQELLRDTARKFLDSECPTQFVRRMMDTDAAVTDEFWQQLAENGWLGIAYSEAEGGSGLGLVDLVVLMEEIGRAVMPGPYPATVLLGGAAIALAGSPEQRREWLPRIAGGTIKATLALTEPNARWDAAGITATAREARGGFTLTGAKMFVPDAQFADVLVVAARSRDGSTMEDGVSLFLVPKDMAGLAIRRLPSVDETRKLCEVTLDNVVVPGSALLGELHQGWVPLQQVVDRAAVALSAEMCGAAQRVLDMTVDYAKLRVAFGKPIDTARYGAEAANDSRLVLELSEDVRGWIQRTLHKLLPRRRTIFF